MRIRMSFSWRGSGSQPGSQEDEPWWQTYHGLTGLMLLAIAVVMLVFSPESWLFSVLIALCGTLGVVTSRRSERNRRGE